MQPGSIVVVLPLEKLAKSLIPYIKWLPKDDEKTPYIVRDIIVVDKDKAVIFEEGCIGHLPNGMELGVDLDKVREILPPDEIPEEIKEVMEEPVTI